MTKGQLRILIKEMLKEATPLPTAAPAATSATPQSPAANQPADVKNLAKAQQSATSVSNKAKEINTTGEFAGAFENWFNTLGYQPGKVSKAAVRNQVDQVLTKLGYK